MEKKMENKNNMVYVACPYWHDDENIRNYRRRKAIEYSTKLFHQGRPFYSPLLYSEKFKDNKAKEGYWINHGLKMVEICDEMHVLSLEGFELSSGLKGEIKKAEKLNKVVKYIDKLTRISFHGSRTITHDQAIPVILSEIEKHQPESIVTHGEPLGACEHVRNLCKKEGISLTLHFLQHWRLAGQFHWRSTKVLEDAEHSIFLHDGISDGTANELKLAKKMGLAYTYYVLKNGVLTIEKHESNDAKDFSQDLISEDTFEKGITKEARGSAEYKRFRQQVLDRDGNKCVFCGATENLVVHHIMPYSKVSTFAVDPSNGQTLCETCHYQVHGKVKKDGK